MSYDGKLADRARRREERLLGEPVLMAFATWPTIELVTPDDRHYVRDRQTGAIEQTPPEHVIHYSTCPSPRDEHGRRVGPR